MDIQPAFRIYLTDPLGFENIPFVVTTAYMSQRGGIHSEWFLVIPEGKGVLHAQCNRLDHTALSKDSFKMDAETLLAGSLHQGVLRLRRHIMENKQKLAPLLLAKTTATRETDVAYLAQLWMHGQFCGCMSEIRAKSKCPALVDKLSWVLGLPMLAVEAI